MTEIKFDEFREKYLEFLSLMKDNLRMRNVLKHSIDEPGASFDNEFQELLKKIFSKREDLRKLSNLLVYQMNDTSVDQALKLQLVFSMSDFVNNEIDRWENRYYGSVDDTIDPFQIDFLFMISSKLNEIFESGIFSSKINAFDAEVDNAKKRPLTAPAIACFCKLVNESELMPKEDTEKNADYCKRICQEYNLPYTERVRQNFSSNITTKNVDKVKALILPNIPDTHKEGINKYLNNKNTPKRNLYG